MIFLGFGVSKTILCLPFFGVFHWKKRTNGLGLRTERLAGRHGEAVGVIGLREMGVENPITWSTQNQKNNKGFHLQKPGF